MARLSSQHRIPKFLLKRWASEDGELFRYVFEDGGVKVDKVPAKRATRQDWDNWSEWWEAEFSKIESHAARILSEVENRSLSIKDFTSDQEEHWQRFVVTLAGRSDRIHTNSRELLREMVADIELAVADKAVVEVERMRVWSEFLEKEAQRLLGSLMMFRPIRNTANTLLIADRPVAWKLEPYMYLALPVGPRLLYFASDHGDRFHQIGDMNDNELVERINEESVRNSDGVIYSDRNSHQRFIQRRRVSGSPRSWRRSDA